jgi:hypothetical protein
VRAAGSSRPGSTGSNSARLRRECHGLCRDCADPATASCQIPTGRPDSPSTRLRCGDGLPRVPTNTPAGAIVVRIAMPTSATVTTPEMIGLLTWWSVMLVAPVVLLRRWRRCRVAARIPRPRGPLRRTGEPESVKEHPATPAGANQRRLVRSKTHAATDGGETRSDAPKSIAGSLLVPADMLPSAIPADGNLEGNAHNDAGEPPPGLTTDDSTDRASAEDVPQQNPFLVPEAARVEHGSRPARRPMIAPLLAHSRGLISAWRRPPRPPSHLVAMPRRLGERRLTLLLALAALTGAVVVTAVIITRPNVAHPSSEPALRAAGLLSPRESRALTAASNPFTQQAAAPDRAPHRVRRVRAQATGSAKRDRRPGRTGPVTDVSLESS